MVGGVVGVGLPHPSGNVASLGERFLQASASLVVGLLAVVPYRLTPDGWKFWTRLVLSMGAGGFIAWTGMTMVMVASRVPMHLRTAGDSSFLRLGIYVLLFGVALPGCLWQCRYLMRRYPSQAAAIHDWTSVMPVAGLPE